MKKKKVKSRLHRGSSAKPGRKSVKKIKKNSKKKVVKKKNGALRKTIHTLNNLLTNISLSSELLIKEIYGDVNAQQKKSLKLIISEGKKIKNLIQKIR